MIRVRRQRNILWMIAIMLCMSAVVVLVMGFTTPYELNQPPDRSSTAPVISQVRATSLPPLSAFDKIGRLDLRRPLYDAPPPVAAVPQAPPPPPLNIKLTGTILEPGHNLAMLLTPEGKLQLISEGQSCGGAQIVKIEEAAVTVLYFGQSIVLKVEKAERT